LRNAYGQLLVAKRVNKSDQVSLTRFDLGSLEDGIYQVEISDGTSKQLHELNLQTTLPVPATYHSIILQ
jgi:hypothetical protein